MDDLVKPWERLIKLARANLSPHLFPDDTRVRSVEEQLARMRCSPNYPEVVAHNVALARELCVAGCLFYELFTASLQFSTGACEVALKERFIDQLSFPCRLTKTEGSGVAEKILSTRVRAFDLASLLSQGWRLENPYRDFRPALGYLIRWASANGIITPDQLPWFDLRCRERNIIAHGHNMVVSPVWALRSVSQTITMLNRLFPDPATTFHDDALRKEREEENRAWQTEWEELVRSIPSAQANIENDQ